MMATMEFDMLIKKNRELSLVGVIEKERYFCVFMLGLYRFRNDG